MVVASAKFLLIEPQRSLKCVSLEYDSAEEHIVVLSENKELLMQSCLKFNVAHTLIISLWGSFVQKSGYTSSYVLLMEVCGGSKSLYGVVDKIGDGYKSCIIVCKYNEGGVKELLEGKYMRGVKIVVEGVVGSVKVDAMRKVSYGNQIKVAWIAIPPFVINTTLSKNPGIYVSLFNTINEITGIKVIYDEKTDFTEEFLTNGTYHQLTRYVQNGSADVGIGRLYMNSSHTTVGRCYFSDEIVFLARRQRKLPFYRYLLKIFKPTLWCLILFAFASTCLVAIITTQTNPYKIPLELFRMLLGTGGDLPLKTTTIKLLILFYSLYCLTMDSIYLSKLSSELAIPAREKRISHVDVLVEYHVKVYVPQIADKISLIAYYTSINTTWKRGGHPINTTEYHLLRNIAQHQENSTLAFMSTLRTFPSERAATTIFRWKIYWPLFVTYYLRENNPVNRVVNFWAEEAWEKGFVQKWWDDIARSNVNRSLYKVADDGADTQETDALKIAHFEEILCVLVGGWVIGILFFLLELSVKCYGGLISQDK